MAKLKKAPGRLIGRGKEAAIAANAVATLLRFLLFRGWIFRSRRPAIPADDAPVVLEMETAR